MDYPEYRTSVTLIAVAVASVVGILIGALTQTVVGAVTSALSSPAAISVYDYNDDDVHGVVARFRVQRESENNAATIAQAKTSTIEALRAAMASGKDTSRVVVQGWLPVTDDYGVITDTAVVNLTYTNETMRRVHLDTIPEDSVWSIADEGTVLPEPLWSR